MQLEEILTLCEQENGAKFLFEEETLVIYANQIQKMAFAKDLKVFEVFSVLNIFHEISLSSTGYTNCATTDLSKNVIGTTSGAIGSLEDYNNLARLWHVHVTSGTFIEGEQVTIQTGTGIGTIDDSVDIYKGPYSTANLDIPCRKLKGVSSVTDSQIFGGDDQDVENDYGMIRTFDMQRDFWTLGRVNQVSKTFTFINTPVLTEGYYRWVYYRGAPTIASISDNDNLVLPEEYHYSVLYNGIIALADNATYGEKPTTPDQILYPYLSQYWAAMEDQYLDVGEDNHRRLGW